MQLLEELIELNKNRKNGLVSDLILQYEAEIAEGYTHEEVMYGMRYLYEKGDPN